MDPMTADVPVLRAAHVTLDVLHNGVIWGWFVTPAPPAKAEQSLSFMSTLRSTRGGDPKREPGEK
jgi:hypothetical protein